jgi:AsmA family protein
MAQPKRHLRITIKAKGEKLSNLSKLAGAELPALGPWHLKTELEDLKGGYAARKIDLQVADTDMSGEATVLLGGKRPNLQAKLASKLVNLDKIAPAPEKKSTGSEKKTAAPDTKAPTKAFSSKKIDFSGLKAVDAKLSYKASKVTTNKIDLQNLALDVSLSNGLLRIKSFKVAPPGATVFAKAHLDGSRSTPDFALRVDSKKIKLDQLEQALLGTAPISGRGDLLIDLKGRGASPASMAGSLDGSFRFLVGKGTAKTGALDAAIGGFSQVVGAMVAKKSDHAILNCLATDFTFKKGVASTNLLVIDTEFSTLAGDGKIDLKQEKLKLTITPEPKNTTLNVATPLLVGGTFLNPTVIPEPLAAVRKVAGIIGLLGGGAIAAPVLLLAESGGDDPHPCQNVVAMQKGKKVKMQKKKSTTEKTKEAIGDSLGGIGKGLKGLFGN